MADDRGAAAFPASARLDHSAQFSRVFRDGMRSRDGYFTLLARPNQLGFARLGMAISRKHAGNAVRRNRIRRVIRESFRHRRAMLAGLDIVVLGRPGLGRMDNARLFASLDRHWQRLSKKCA